MKLRLLNLSLSLFWLTGHWAQAQSADDFFHNGAVNYLSNNIPKALEVVTNGLAVFPEDIKLKKLEELLKQQNQQQQQQKEEQQKKQDEKKEQSKQDQKEDQQQQQQSKDDQQKQDQPQQSKSKPEDKPDKEPQQATAHAMTPQEAKQLLDAQKGDEKVLQFVPQGEAKTRTKALKDW